MLPLAVLIELSSLSSQCDVSKPQPPSHNASMPVGKVLCLTLAIKVSPASFSPTSPPSGFPVVWAVLSHLWPLGHLSSHAFFYCFPTLSGPKPRPPLHRRLPSAWASAS